MANGCFRELNSDKETKAVSAVNLLVSFINTKMPNETADT